MCIVGYFYESEISANYGDMDEKTSAAFHLSPTCVGCMRL